MPAFTIRVELHDADSNDYELLHELMRGGGFSKEIEGSNGKKYELPTAEYNYEKDGVTRQDVLSKVKSLATNVQKKPSILVTESNGRTWSNLELV